MAHPCIGVSADGSKEEFAGKGAGAAGKACPLTAPTVTTAGGGRLPVTRSIRGSALNRRGNQISMRLKRSGWRARGTIPAGLGSIHTGSPADRDRRR